MAANEHIAGELQKLVAEFEALAKTALASAGEQAGNAADELHHGVQVTDRYVRDRPWVVIGIAAVTAFLVGVAVARRK